MIIWLASYPKSGNTWLRAILHQIIVKKNNNHETWLSNLHKLVDTYPKTEHFQNLNSVLIKESDFLSTQEYSTALVEFIEECDTPMTIGIQGDWGIGKTSMMSMIKAQIIGNF